jgi:hypothetical protein
MNILRRRNLLILCFVMLAAAIWFSIAKKKPAGPAPPGIPGTQVSSAPENPFPESSFKISNVEAAVTEQNARLKTHRRIKLRTADMTEGEKAQLAKEFTEKIRPEVARWCGAYAGHLPFRLEDVTVDKLVEVANLRSDAHGYDFMINGTDLGVLDDAGKVFVDSLTAPAANDLFRVPTNPPPPVEGSVSKEEILRLLKADSGKDFPPDQIAISPTGRSTAMNGGVSVDVGEHIHAAMTPLPKYAMVFGPDGNLVCYGRSAIQ